MAVLGDIPSLDWAKQDMPDGFQPLSAIVLVKGVYIDEEDGEMTRPVWMHRWTRDLAQNPSERLGALSLAHELTMREARSDYTFEEGEE